MSNLFYRAVGEAALVAMLYVLRQAARDHPLALMLGDLHSEADRCIAVAFGLTDLTDIVDMTPHQPSYAEAKAALEEWRREVLADEEAAWTTIKPGERGH